MTRREVDEAEFRALVAAYPLYAVAERLNMNRRAVSILASRYGLTSAFAARKATADEEVSIQAWAEEGLSVSQIAARLGRSHEFIARRLNERASSVDSTSEHSETRAGWPTVETNISDALQGRVYEDVARKLLDRESPPSRAPINGAALAAAGRFASTSFTRSSADLCTDV